MEKKKYTAEMLLNENITVAQQLNHKKLVVHIEKCENEIRKLQTENKHITENHKTVCSMLEEMQQLYNKQTEKNKQIQKLL